MWYDKTHMRALFYIGAMVFFLGIGLWAMSYTIPGVVLMCFGIAGIIIGFKGLKTNLLIEMKMRRKQEMIRRNRGLE